MRLVVSDKCPGLVESLAEFYPGADRQRCTVHFYRNVWSYVPKSKVKVVAAMLKAIHAQEDREAALEKVEAVVAKLRGMKLGNAADCVAEGAEETLRYMKYPREHWSLHTNNPLECVMREIRRRTRVVGGVPRRQQRIDAGGGQAQTRGLDEMGHTPLPRHGSPGRARPRGNQLGGDGRRNRVVGREVLKNLLPSGRNIPKATRTSA